MKRVSLALALAALSVPAAAAAAQTSQPATSGKASVGKVKIYGTVKAIGTTTVTVANATKTRISCAAPSRSPAFTPAPASRPRASSATASSASPASTSTTTPHPPPARPRPPPRRRPRRRLTTRAARPRSAMTPPVTIAAVTARTTLPATARPEHHSRLKESPPRYLGGLPRSPLGRRFSDGTSERPRVRGQDAAGERRPVGRRRLPVRCQLVVKPTLRNPTGCRCPRPSDRSSAERGGALEPARSGTVGRLAERPAERLSRGARRNPGCSGSK